MDAVEDIKSRLSIEDVISEYVQLKRAGRNFKGLSPFSNEKTPSFMVSPEKQIWHDFSSGKGGNMFSFVMEMEGLDFKGALEHLARKAGVDLAQYRTGNYKDTSKFKDRLYDANEQATKFYQVHFSKSEDALNYIFKQRKFTKEVALAFRIGYSPNNGTALYDYLKKQKFTDEELLKSGLVTKRYRGQIGDMFRGRLMVPLMDPVGKVIGFTARQLDDDKNAPKYINTQQTLLYDKGRHVFGLHLAKEAIRKTKQVVVVEGNLDVIASHQADIKQVVATAGTAMTPMHLKIIGRFTDDVRIAFDQDEAGLRAAERTIPLASQANVNLSIITVPSGKDPDELIKKDPKLWVKAINDNQYALDWLIERQQTMHDTTQADGKRRFTDALMSVLRGLKDPVEQDHYIQKLAKLISVSDDALRSKFEEDPNKRLRVKKQPKIKHDTTIVKDQIEFLKIQDHFLSLLLLQPALRYLLEGVLLDMCATDEARGVLLFLQENPGFNGDPKEAGKLKELADYVKILGLQYEELYQGLELVELRNEAARLRVRLIDHYVKSKKSAIMRELEQANEKRTQELLERVRELDRLRKNL